MSPEWAIVSSCFSCSLALSCQLCDPMDCSTPGLPGDTVISWSLLKCILIAISYSNALFYFCPWSLSDHRFSKEWSVCNRWPKCWSFSFRHSRLSCCCSVTQSCPTLGLCRLKHARLPCASPSPRACSNSCPLNQWVSDAIQPSHPLIPFCSAFNLSQHQGLSQWLSSLQRWQKYWSFSFSFGIFSIEFPLWLTDLISMQSKGLSRVFSNTKVQKHQSFGAQPSLCSNSHIHTWLLEKP